MNRLQHFSKIGVCLWMLSIVFITFGIYRGEVSTMFQKAISICFECIGIG